MLGSRKTLPILLIAACLGVRPIGTIGQIPSVVGETTIGSLDGEDGPIFGLVTRAVVDGELLWVLDNLGPTGQLSVFSLTGEVIARTGARGEGPGEFGFPVALAPSGEGIAVFDVANARISTYLLRGNELGLNDEMRLPFAVSDACALSGRIFVLGFHEGLIHELDSGGSVVRSFGEPFLPDVPSVDFGRILCRGPDALIVSSTHVPVVRRYTTDGAMLWETEYEGFAPHRIEANAHGGRSFSGPPGGGHPDMMATLTSRADRVVAVQYGPFTPGMRTTEAMTQLRTVLLDFETGVPVDETRDTPRIDVLADTIAVAHPALPYPRVVVYRIMSSN
ncbi:MAG: 6-bladed beta-propeller [Gemmatimonadota bacterium]|nr:6-bladed beta-propeller [Gemmatimonadota bacterium]